MKIIICSSMKLSKNIVEVEDELKKLGHLTIIPEFTREYCNLDSMDKMHSEAAKNKMKYDLIREYFLKIKKSDAILVLNEKLNGIEGYVGGNSFLEMGFAHVLNKRIYLMKPIPRMHYQDELLAMNPIILNGDLSKIN